MIPRTFLSTYAANGQQQMAVKFLTDITGLTRWSDYIPVKLTQGGSENTYANNGFIDVVSVDVTSTMRPFAEYVPIYVDFSATDAWQVNATGYIPYGYAGFGGANMVLDFTNGSSLDSRITFTRASTATRTNPSGVIESVAINGARFDYDPVTLASKGLLIEEQRTNLVLRSEEFSNASWTKTNSSITADTIVAPNGTLTADKLVEDTATGNHDVRQSATTTAADHSFSVYLKSGERQFALLWNSTANFGRVFNLSNGTVSGTVTGVTQATASISSIGNGWYRCTIIGTCTAASNNFRVYAMTDATTFSYTGDGYSGIYIWGAQLEAGAFATSYIPTVASQVTRSADVATMTGTNFSSWYNGSEGTLYGQADWLGLSNNDYFFAINNGTSSNLIALGVSVTPITRFIVIDGGVTQASVAGLTPVANTPFKIAGAYKVNSFAAATNGTLGTVDTSGSIPTGMSEVSLTSSFGSTNLFNGHIRKIAYYPTRLTNAQLQSLTS